MGAFDGTILAIDPGPEESGYLILGDKILDMGKIINDYLEDLLYSKRISNLRPSVVVEIVKSYGMPAGDSLFRTMWWLGRFSVSCDNMCYHYYEVTRKAVVSYLCNSGRAKDSNVRQALIDKYEPDLPPKKRPKKFLKGVSKDMWSALAIATYFKENFDEQFKDIRPWKKIS